MGCVKADRVSNVPSSFSFDPTMTVHSRKNHYHGAMTHSSDLQLPFVSVSIHDTEYVSKEESRAAIKTKNLVVQITIKQIIITPIIGINKIKIMINNKSKNKNESKDESENGKKIFIMGMIVTLSRIKK